MRKTNGWNAVLCLAAFFLLCVAILFCITSVEADVAYAEEAIKDISRYMADNEYNSNANLESHHQIIVYGDDPIVNYVPKELFMQEGQELNIVGDYGYYIYTFPDRYRNADGWGHAITKNFHSFLLVFSIEYSVLNVEGSTTADGFAYEIKPLFQREYATLMPDGKDNVGLPDYSIGEFNEKKSLSAIYNYYYRHPIGCEPAEGVSREDGLVVPVPQKSGDFSSEYKDVNIFYLKDITVGAQIQNEQDPNVGDIGYDAYEDDGSFLIGAGYDMHALEYVSGSDDWDGAVLNTLHFVGKQVVGAALGASGGAGAILSGALAFVDHILGLDNHFESDQFVSRNDLNYYGSGKDSIPNTKVAQLEKYGGLYKSAAVSLAESGDANAWIGVGGDFKAVFETSGSTGNEPGWRTVVYAALSLSVDGMIKECSHPTADYGTYVNVFNSLRDKPLSEDVASEAYIMARDGDIEGKDSFAFTAPRNGLYEVSLTNGSGVDYIITDSADTIVYEPISGGMYYFEEGKEYIIELTNITSSLKRPTVKVGMATLEASSGDYYTFLVPAGETIAFRLDFEAEFTKMAVFGQGISIHAIKENLADESAVDDTTYCHHKGSGVHYVFVTNSGATDNECTMTFANLDNLEGGDSDVEAYEYDSYYYFVAESRNYIFEYDFGELSVGIMIYDSDGNEVYFIQQANTAVVYGLEIGATYIIEFNSLLEGETGKGTVNITKAEEDIQWYVDDIPVDVLNISLARGWSYDIELHVGQLVLTDFSFIPSKENVGIDSDGTFVIDEKCAIQPEYVNIVCWWLKSAENGDVVVEHCYLCVDVTDHARITFVDTASTETQIGVTVAFNDPFIDKIEYTLSFRNILLIKDSLSGEVDVDDVSAETFTFWFKAVGATYERNLTIKGINSVTGEERYSFSVTDVAYEFGGGDGTEDDPFIINCTRHYACFLVAALADATNSSGYTVRHWKLTADLNIKDLSASSSAFLRQFYGVFDGNGHTLSGLTLEIPVEAKSWDNDYGWIQENYGTVMNVKFSDVTITGGVCHDGGWVNVGVVAGTNHSGAAIRNVELENVNISVDRSLSRIGGIAGLNEGEVSDCTAGHVLFGNPQVTLFSNGDLGIICGENRNLISGCQVFFVTINYYPSVNDRSVGGIAGYCSAGKISDCVVWLCAINVTGTDANIFPKIGSVAGHVTNKNMLVNNTAYCNVDVSKLSDAQKVNCCTDNSRQYGLEG